MASDITPEAVGFLSAVGIFIVALALLFLFINKKLCFSEVGGLPCLEPRGQRRRRNRTGNHAGLVKSFGNEEDDYGSSSSDSEAEIIKQFEISVSRSQSFKNTNATSGGTKEVLAAKTGPAQSQSSRSLNKRHKFSRLSDNEETSIGPPNMEDSAAQPQDPLSATAEEVQTKSTSKTGPSRRSRGSAQLPQTVLSQSRSSLNQSVPSPSLSAVRQEADGSEDFEAPTAGDQDDDSSSTWSPEQEQPPVLEAPLPSVPRVPMSKCADLSLSLDYSPEQEHVSVTVLAVRDLPDKTRSGMDSWQIHMVLLPTKKQRQKTSVQRGDSPEFNETFRFSRIEPSDLHVSALRFRLYAQGGRIPRERMMGEKILRLSELDPEGGSLSTTLLMQPRSNIKSVGSQMSLSPDSASSTQSLTHGGAPELLLGLSYNATTGRMSVEVVKGSHFRNLALSRPPDTYGRLSLLNSVGQEISRCKTSVRRGQPNPVYKETFMFQVALFQLSDVTLLVSVFSRRSMKRKEMVGWVALGQNSSEHSGYLLQTFDHLRTSNVAYFKRKYAEEEEDLPPTAPTAYLHRHLILSEDRSCILALSLEKLRFPVDPEMFLRRSVLIHNLLRKIHRETMAPGSSERSDLGVGVRGPDLSSGLKPSLKPSVNSTRKRMRRALTEFQPQTILVYDNG